MHTVELPTPACSLYTVLRYTYAHAVYPCLIFTLSHSRSGARGGSGAGRTPSSDEYRVAPDEEDEFDEGVMELPEPLFPARTSAGAPAAGERHILSGCKFS